MTTALRIKLMRQKVTVTFCLIILSMVYSVVQGSAQEAEEIPSLKAKIAQEDKNYPQYLEQLAKIYFSTHAYDDFCEYLKGLLKKGYDQKPEVYFYLALTRQEQVQHWQKTKNWEAVYDRAPSLKEGILKNLDSAEALAQDNLDLLLSIKYVRWKSIKDDDYERAFGLFNDLVNNARVAPNIDEVKDVADELSLLEDKGLSRRLYDVYISRLSESRLSQEELKNTANKFLDQDNAYLAKSLFEAYLNQFSDSKEERAKAIVAVADKFAHNGSREGLDPFYAESLYQKAYDLVADAAFAMESQYRRAFNLERMKECSRAFDEYKKLIQLYPEYAQKPRVLFRMGVLAAYGLKHIVLAQENFSKIYSEFPKDLMSVSSLYQLGLLSHYKHDMEKAKEFYQSCLKTAQEQGFNLETDQIVLMANERLKEIEDKKEIKHPLRLFLEGTFEGMDRAESFGGLIVDLTGRPAKADVNHPINFVVTTSNPQTGCMMPAYSYEWSGETGAVVNIPNSPELTTQYLSAGIKVVHVAVVGPQGLEGVAFEMVEVTEKNN